MTVYEYHFSYLFCTSIQPAWKVLHDIVKAEEFRNKNLESNLESMQNPPVQDNPFMSIMLKELANHRIALLS